MHDCASDVQDQHREHRWSALYTISVLIVNLKQQEIHCDPQPFVVHSLIHTHEHAAVTHTVPPKTSQSNNRDMQAQCEKTEFKFNVFDEKT